MRSQLSIVGLLRRGRTTPPVAIAFGALLVACGGSVRFADTAAIAVASQAPKPPEPAPRAELRDDRIAIHEKVQFAYNDDRILPQSFGLLDEVAEIIKKNPRVRKIEIGGHASTEGADDYNLRLSDRRARAVMTHLVQKAGVDATRLTSKGYGEQKPLVHPDDAEEQREVNRRVEFLILEQDPPSAEAETASAAAAEKAEPAAPEGSAP